MVDPELGFTNLTHNSLKVSEYTKTDQFGFRSFGKFLRMKQHFFPSLAGFVDYTHREISKRMRVTSLNQFRESPTKDCENYEKIKKMFESIPVY